MHLVRKALRECDPHSQQRGRSTPMNVASPLAVAGIVMFSCAGALAQIAPGDPAGNQTIPEKEQAPPAASPGDGQREGKSLSDKLDSGGGVIKPAPEVDPDIVKPAPVPNPGSTPVIPPPGVLGGPPGPEPK